MRQILTRRIADVDLLFDLIERFAAAHALPKDLRLDLGVIAEELFTNQVRHAGPGTPHVVVELELHDGAVHLTVIDEDVEPFDPREAPEPDLGVPAAERRSGGLGIHFVRTLSDSIEWNYDAARRTSRTTVTRRLER